jgi:AraC-like DNA-binding protein
MKIAIKNMVCPRCNTVVRGVIASAGLNAVEVGLGYAVLDCEEMTKEQWGVLDEKLRQEGFELISDKDIAVVERIKLEVIRFVRENDSHKVKLSSVLETAMGMTYKNLTRIFSQIEGRTIENYCVSQRIEYVKELISYGELSLADIAFRTGYSSVAYLSRQFSQNVGMTISEYRNSPNQRRLPLTNV